MTAIRRWSWCYVLQEYDPGVRLHKKIKLYNADTEHGSMVETIGVIDPTAGCQRFNWCH